MMSKHPQLLPLVTLLVLLCGIAACGPASQELVVHYGKSYQAERTYQQGSLSKQQLFYLHPDYQNEFSLIHKDADRFKKHLDQDQHNQLGSFVPESTYFSAAQAKQLIEILDRDISKDARIRAGEQVLLPSLQKLKADLLLPEPQAQFAAKGVTVSNLRAGFDLFVVFDDGSSYGAVIDQKALESLDSRTLTINLSEDNDVQGANDTKAVKGVSVVRLENAAHHEEAKLLNAILEANMRR